MDLYPIPVQNVWFGISTTEENKKLHNIKLMFDALIQLRVIIGRQTLLALNRNDNGIISFVIISRTLPGDKVEYVENFIIKAINPINVIPICEFIIKTNMYLAQIMDVKIDDNDTVVKVIVNKKTDKMMLLREIALFSKMLDTQDETVMSYITTKYPFDI